MKNNSGIFPTEFKAVVRPVKVEEKTKGGIFLPDEHKEREQFAQMEGTLVAVSPHAFSYADWSGAESLKPRAGDRVLFAKYAGAMFKGNDGSEYRIINDKDISAVLSD